MKRIWQRIKGWFARRADSDRVGFPAAAVGSNVEKVEVNNEQLVRDELAALLQRTNEDAFVTFEDTQSGKFVQFAGRAGDPLCLDLPSQTLSEAEFYRAVRYFKSHAESLHEYDLLDQPGGVPVGRQASFQMILGGDVQRAAQITMEIFLQVFQLRDDISLRIERN